MVAPGGDPPGMEQPRRRAQVGRAPVQQLVPESPSRVDRAPRRRPAVLVPWGPAPPHAPGPGSRSSQPEAAPRSALTREVIEGRGDVLGGVAVGGIADHQAGLAHRAVADQHALDAAPLGAARASPAPGHPGPARPAPPALPARRYGRCRRRLATGGQRGPALLRSHRGRRPRDQLPPADKGGVRSALCWATVPARPRCGRACSAGLPCDTGGRGKRRVRRRLLQSEATAPPSASRACVLRRRLETVRLADLAPPHQPTRTLSCPCPLLRNLLFPTPPVSFQLSQLLFLPLLLQFPQHCHPILILFPHLSRSFLLPLILLPSLVAPYSSPQSPSCTDPCCLPVPAAALASPHKCLGLGAVGPDWLSSPPGRRGTCPGSLSS